MSKIKLYLMIAAVISGVFGAIAGNKRVLCENYPQYYKFGNSYLPAGDYGIDYICLSAAGNCTYYLSNPFNPNSFVPCRVGAFSWAYSNKH
jgi:hypothetical protein